MLFLFVVEIFCLFFFFPLLKMRSILIFNLHQMPSFSSPSSPASFIFHSSNATSPQQRIQIRLGVIMSLTVLEFCIFQLPMSSIIVATYILRFNNSLAMNANVATFTFAFWFIDAIINPLWTTMLFNKGLNRISTTSIKT